MSGIFSCVPARSRMIAGRDECRRCRCARKLNRDLLVLPRSQVMARVSARMPCRINLRAGPAVDLDTFTHARNCTLLGPRKRHGQRGREGGGFRLKSTRTACPLINRSRQSALIKPSMSPMRDEDKKNRRVTAIKRRFLLLFIIIKIGQRSLAR